MTPKTLSCVIVDDEKDNLEVLTEYVFQVPSLLLKATFVKPIEALTYLLKNSTDLLITDVDMPQLSGIDLYLAIRAETNTQVIFVSGYPERMMEAIQYTENVIDYLPKPLSQKRFEKATQKALFFSSLDKKSFEDLPPEILKNALENYSILSETEKKILKMIAEGNTINEISDLAFIAPRTVESHRYTIRKKLKLLPDISLTQISIFIMESLK